MPLIPSTSVLLWDQVASAPKVTSEDVMIGIAHDAVTEREAWAGVTADYTSAATSGQNLCQTIPRLARLTSCAGLRRQTRGETLRRPPNMKNETYSMPA
jgi:hypothetical protein